MLINREKRYKTLEKRLKRMDFDDKDLKEVEKAWKFAKLAHDGQKRL
jgi:(p)ppGpp synthase/HD superfamily hydrolase